MAKKYYLVTVSWSLNQDIPTAKPEGFVWKATKNLYMRLESIPPYQLIKNLARRRGVPESGFRVDAISEIPDDYVKDWADYDVFTKDQPDEM